MHLRKGIVFLTFVEVMAVGIVGLANPHYEAPASLQVTDENYSKVKPETEENISVVQPKKFSQEQIMQNKIIDREFYYYSYKKELEIHAGAVYGVKDSSDDEDDINILLGFSYMLPKKFSPKYVIGADLSFVGHGHMYFSKRNIYNEKSAFRPYIDYGIMHKFVPDEQGASLSNWENYLLRLGVGFGDTKTPPRSLKLDLNIAIGVEDILAILTCGYAWGF